MEKQIAKSEIYDVLSTLEHPEIPGGNLLELGMIPAVTIHNQYITVQLDNTFAKIADKKGIS